MSVTERKREWIGGNVSNRKQRILQNNLDAIFNNPNIIFSLDLFSLYVRPNFSKTESPEFPRKESEDRRDAGLAEIIRTTIPVKIYKRPDFASDQHPVVAKQPSKLFSFLELKFKRRWVTLRSRIRIPPTDLGGFFFLEPRLGNFSPVL